MDRKDIGEGGEGWQRGRKGREDRKLMEALWPSASTPRSASGSESGHALPVVLILTVNGEMDD